MKLKLLFKSSRRISLIPSKILFMMKLSALLLAIACMQVSAAAISQKLSVTVENAPLEQVIKIIQKRSGYQFIFNNELLKKAKPVTMNISDGSLEQVLEQCFSNQPLTYSLMEKTIVVKPKTVELKTQTNIIPAPLIDIKGKVADEKGGPLPGVSIIVKGTQRGTTTDGNGLFTLDITDGDKDAVLIFSFVGYISKELPIGTRTSFDISLEADTKALEELVVVGYGTQKKMNLTGAVDQVTSKVLENRSLPNLAQGLQGVIPNLNLVMGDGKPTQSPAYNIRGATSIGSGGSALVLIDGVEGDPSRINPNDVASVSVLKDAASAAIYGARGAFGVVLITTKTPQKDKTTISYSLNHSIKSPIAVPDLVTDGYNFAKMFNEGWSAWNDYSQTPQNVNKTVKFSPAYLAEFEKRSKDSSLPKTVVDPVTGEYVYYENMDWYKELYKKNLSATEHNLSVSGGSGKADFLVTGRYFGQDGLFKYNSDDYKIMSLRVKGSVQLYKWLNISNNADFSSMKYHNPLNTGEGGSIWRNISDEGHTMAPMLNPDGTLTYSAAYTVGDFYYGKNGIDMDRRVFRNTTSFASQFFNDVLRIKGNFTYQNTDNNEYRRRVPVPYSRKPGVIEYVGTNYNDLQNYLRNTQYTATNIYAEYEPKVGANHYFKALAGFNQETSIYKALQVVRNGLIYEDATDINLALGQTISTGGGYDKWAIAGGFYRLNYSYKERYLLELNGRYDGSSKFPSNQRYAFFPSVSAGWRISNESFWKASPKLISELKLRGSYGSLGNGNISSYAFQEKFNITQSGRILNGVRPQQAGQPAVLPNGLTWETSSTADFGVDVSMLANRLTINADAYQRKTTGMFTQGMTLPAVFGTDVPKGNYADLTTKGWEASVTWRDQFTVGSKPLNYSIRLTVADYTAKIDKFNNPDKRLPTNSNDTPTYYTGQKLGEIWGFVNDGYFTSADDITNSAKQILYKASTTGKLLPGDIKFKDLNGDGVIDIGDNTVNKPGDRKIIGNALPRYTYGVTLGGDWNNFFVSAFFQGVGKQDWYPGSEAALFWGQYNRPYNKIPTWQLGNIWSEENPNAYLPRYRGYTAQNSSGELAQNQTKYLQNVAYLRMKNIQIGYNLPQTLISKLKMASARVYVSADNLFTWSPLYKITKDIDVENIGRSDTVLSPADDASNPNRNNSGNGNNYPMLKGFTMGLSVTF